MNTLILNEKKKKMDYIFNLDAYIQSNSFTCIYILFEWISAKLDVTKIST